MAWLRGARGDGPPPAAGPEPGKGGPDRLPRVPRARPRGGRQGARQAPGRAGRRSVASLRERKCGGPGRGLARLGRAGRASTTRGPPWALLEASRGSGLHHVGGCGERPRRVHSAGLRGPGGRGGRGGRVRRAPEDWVGGQDRGPGCTGLPAGVGTLQRAAHTRDQWSLRKPIRTCLGSFRARLSSFVCYVSD